MKHTNRGQTGLPLRKRQGDPMKAYDAAPPELRRWMASAALPWSVKSCLAIWKRAASPEDAIRRLQAAQTKQLERAQGGTPGPSHG